jgi:hypothetical protein
MKVRDREEVFTTGFDPLLFPEELAFRAMSVPTGVIGYHQMTAVVALIDMASQKSSPTSFNGLHGS